MRRAALVTLLLAGTLVLAGCLGPTSDDEVDAQSEAGATPVALPEVPEGASVEEVPGGLRLTWTDVDLTFEQEVPIPEGATMVRAHAEVGADEVLYVDMAHADTGRRRCNTPYVQGWNEPTVGAMTCSGVAGVDDLPTDWRVRVRGGSDVPEADLVQVEILTTPLDGPVADLDLENVTKPRHDLRPTEDVTVESFDGTELHAQVTLPEGEGPWPTILASSPYNAGYYAAGEPAMWEYFVQDWAKRGYAVVMADVRGTGYSGGCMEVWGPKETRDQAVLVDWAARQPWSDGHVGFYGQSYVGTTPVEAAVQAPEALDAIIAVAPVVNAYDDWHFGGVPNGENWASPLVAYQAGTGTLDKAEMLLGEADPAASARHAANGVCDPTLTPRANDPRALYTDYYEVRNFSTRADEVEAAVMYTHGFADPNVKTDMAVPWFNAVDSPKLGLFGHWTHQHPPRADTEPLMLAWMETHVKGEDVGLDALPNALVRTNVDTQRAADAWPPTDPDHRTLWPALGEGRLEDAPQEGSAKLLLSPTAATGPRGPASSASDAAGLQLETTLEEPLQIAGKPGLRLRASLQGSGNAHVAAFLYEVAPDGEEQLVTFGMANLAHREGHDTYEPVPPGEEVTMTLPFNPTEHVVREGHTLQLVVRGAGLQDWFSVEPTPPGKLTLHGGEDGVALELPLAPAGSQPMPATAQP